VATALGLALAPAEAGQESLQVAVRRPAAAPAGVVGLAIDPAAHAALLGRDRAIVREFPLPDGPVDLDLVRVDVLAPGARLIVVDERGPRAEAPPAFRAFRGSVVGDPDSAVVLSLFDGLIAGTIRTAAGDFVVGSRPDADGPGLWPRALDPDRPRATYCAGDLVRPAEAPVPGTGPPQAAAAGGAALLVASVAIDASYDWYLRFGSIPAASGYILSLIAQASAMYEAGVSVRLEVPYLRVFSTPADPYSGGASTSALLGELRAEWNAHQTGVARTVAHLFSTWPSGGAGIAYIDVLCDHAAHPGSSYDYGVSALATSGASWEAELVAHELGHNFSSPHTHCYVPEIDHCANQSGCYAGPIEQTVGTIMSYCNAVDPVFHPQVQDQIRPAAEAAYPACIALGAPGPPAPQNVHRTDTVE